MSSSGATAFPALPPGRSFRPSARWWCGSSPSVFPACSPMSCPYSGRWPSWRGKCKSRSCPVTPRPGGRLSSIISTPARPWRSPPRISSQRRPRVAAPPSASTKFTRSSNGGLKPFSPPIAFHSQELISSSRPVPPPTPPSAPSPAARSPTWMWRNPWPCTAWRKPSPICTRSRWDF